MINNINEYWEARDKWRTLAFKLRIAKKELTIGEKVLFEALETQMKAYRMINYEGDKFIYD